MQALQTIALATRACRELAEVHAEDYREIIFTKTPQGDQAEIFRQQHQHIYQCPYYDDEFFDGVRAWVAQQMYHNIVFSVKEEAIFLDREVIRYMQILASHPLDVP